MIMSVHLLYISLYHDIFEDHKRVFYRKLEEKIIKGCFIGNWKVNLGVLALADPSHRLQHDVDTRQPYQLKICELSREKI